MTGYYAIPKYPTLSVYLIDLMLPMGKFDDWLLRYTNLFPSELLHLAYITSRPLELLWVDITSQEHSFDSLLR